MNDGAKRASTNGGIYSINAKDGAIIEQQALQL